MAPFFLGIHSFQGGHDAGLAVIDEHGTPQVVLEAERFIKIKKNSHHIPTALRDEVFSHIDPKQIIGIGISQFQQLFPDQQGQPLLPHHLDLAHYFPNLISLNQFRHHASHAFSAFYPSPFAEALIITADGNGEFPEAVTVAQGDGTGLKTLWNAGPKTSPGALYKVIGAHYCGLAGSEGEGKAMALAAYGTPCFKDKILSFLVDFDRGAGTLDFQAPYKVTDTDQLLPFILAQLEKHLGPRRPMQEYPPDQLVEEHYANVAASAQAILEEYFLTLVEKWTKSTGLKSLCLAGGTAMNSAMNGVILRSGLVDDIFVQPASADNGLALGAAYGALSCHLPNWRQAKKRCVLPHTYYGSETAHPEIRQALTAFQLPARRIKKPALEAARQISQGKIIGWFQGRMEYGARALGNRCILSQPSGTHFKDAMNIKVKDREIWRPFAPATTNEAMATYFTSPRPEPFMTVVYEVKREWQHKLPAITHVDGTARVQTVAATTNPPFHALIKEVGRLTGLEMVLSTSLNGKGQPIARTPGEALALFVNSDMDSLLLHDFLVTKADKPTKQPYYALALAALLELAQGEPFLAEMVRCDAPLTHQQEEEIKAAVHNCGGTFANNQATHPQQKIILVLGEYKSLQHEVVEHAKALHLAGEYAEVKCLEFLPHTIHHQFSGVAEIMDSTPRHISSIQIPPLAHRFTVDYRKAFIKLAHYQPAREIVLTPAGTITKAIMEGKTPLAYLIDRISSCGDQNPTKEQTEVNILSHEKIREHIQQANPAGGIDLFITSLPHRQAIYKEYQDLSARCRIMLITPDFDIYQLQSLPTENHPSQNQADDQ